MDPPLSTLRVCVDHRERPAGLMAALASLWSPLVEGTLAVGDVEIGRRVLVERKTLQDFATSLRDGRLFSQAYALNGVSRRPLLVLEGEDPLPVLRISPSRFEAVLLTLMVSFRIPVLRSRDVQESAALLARIAAHEARSLARRAKPSTPTPRRQALDLLTSIPGIGDDRARRLLDAFGSVSDITLADDRALESVAGIGPTSIAALRGALGPRVGSRAPASSASPVNPPSPAT